MKVRNFIYADAKMINSMYNQFYDNISEINTTISKENGMGVRADIPNILRGFSPINFSGEIARDCNSVISAKSSISIEEKIMDLISVIRFGENDVICEWSNNALIVGKVEILQYEYFLKRINSICEKEGYSNFEEFFKKRQECMDFKVYWARIIKEIHAQEYMGNGMDFFKFVSSKGHTGETPLMEKLVVVNTEYPIIINFSYDKVLFSLSGMESYGMFNYVRNISVLGIMRKMECNLYSLKPLALWEILDTNTNDRYSKRLRRFLRERK